jgi:hypothetical protein
MKSSAIVLNAALLGTACLVNAQSRGIRVPVMGFVVDSQSHSLRPIKGFPGASVLGKSINLSVEVTTAKISANGEFALGINSNPAGQLVLIRGLNEETPSSQVVDGTLPAVDLICMNSAGTVAAILSKGTGQIQFVAGLPDQPSAQDPIELTSIIGQATAISIDSQGQSVLVTSSDGTYGGVYQIANQGGATPQLIASAYQPSAVVFLNQDQDAAFADASSNEIIQIQGLSGRLISRVLASAKDNVQNPIALQSSGGNLLATNLGSADSSSVGNLIEYDLAAGKIVADRLLPVVPTRLDSLSGSEFFVINDSGSDILYLYSAKEFSLTFVPAGTN